MTSERECYVYIVLPGATEFVTAGRFRRSETTAGEPIGRFIYGRRYRERVNAVELDPVELRLSSRPFETAQMGGFFGAIRDAMPDYWGRRVIVRHQGRGRLEEFDYLIAGPDDRAGALAFGLNVAPPAPRQRFNRTMDLARLQLLADRIIVDAPEVAGNEARQVEELLLLATAMGGARPKAVVHHDQALWIAKFNRHDDRWNHARTDHAMLELARASGLDIADSRIETVAGRDLLLVRRFDRHWAGDGYRRYRMVSGLTLLRAGDGPGERDKWSYLLLADELRRSSARPETDLRELFARICFNAAISNLDDHPRNHAIVARDRNWRLSPAYDLTPTPSIAIERRDLAMTCGDAGRYANRNNILSGHGRFLLSEDEAKAIFRRVSDMVRGEWYPTLRRAGLGETDCEAIRSAFVYDGLFYDKQR